MSQTEEQNDQTQEQETPSAASEASDQEPTIVDGMSQSSAPSPNAKPLRYGTRRSKPGAEAPKITPISSVTSTFEEEEIEMDDLPVAANAPEHLIDKRTSPSRERDEDDSDRPRRSPRSRGERRRRNDRDRSPENKDEANEEAAPAAADSDIQDEDRPDRFGMVDVQARKEKAAQNAEEFRPSRDGRIAPKRERRPAPATSAPKAKSPKKKGILSKILSFFSGDDAEETPKRDDRNNRGNGQRRSGNRKPRDGENRSSEDGRPRRRRRPRNRKPRPEGASSEQGQGHEGGNDNRRRRRPRRRGNNRGRSDRQTASAE